MITMGTPMALGPMGTLQAHTVAPPSMLLGMRLPTVKLQATRTAGLVHTILTVSTILTLVVAMEA